MPKNSKWGENTKAVEAKVRKATALKADQDKKKQAQEDASWEDDDKHIAKKQNRKDEKEKKRLEAITRKTTSKQLADEEVSSIVASNKPQRSEVKLTQAQIQAERERREAAARKAANSSTTSSNVTKVQPLPENLNRLPQPDEEARTVDEALKMLSLDDSSSAGLDRHPERRVKAAYSAFEEIRLPQLKAENPSLRLTQLKQILYTEWQKSPDNPMNQEKLAYNAK